MGFWGKSREQGAEELLQGAESTLEASQIFNLHHCLIWIIYYAPSHLCYDKAATLSLAISRTSSKQYCSFFQFPKTRESWVICKQKDAKSNWPLWVGRWEEWCSKNYTTDSVWWSASGWRVVGWPPKVRDLHSDIQWSKKEVGLAKLRLNLWLQRLTSLSALLTNMLELYNPRI